MLGISAIGWTDEEEEQILSANAGAFNVLEIVPARIFAQDKDCADIAKEYRESYGLWAYSAQALFFQSNVQSFEDTAAVSEHLLKVIGLGSLMGIKRFVLGSPNLRKGSPSCLMNVLKRMDTVLEANGSILCIEPVAKCYGGSYFFTVNEIVNHIDFCNLKNVKTMLDTNNAWLQGDSPRKLLNHYWPYIAHVHISDTDNGPLLNKYEHKQIKRMLDGINYEGAIVRELFQAKKHMRDYPLFRSIYA
jgi:sugar phosphate isomerase/epimerase